jgi:hypothetical protein
MSKTEEILQSINTLRSEFKTFNDIILPAITKTIEDQIKPVMDKQTEFEKRLSRLEKQLNDHIHDTK